MQTVYLPMIYSPVILALLGLVVLWAVVRGLIRFVSAFVVG